MGTHLVEARRVTLTGGKQFSHWSRLDSAAEFTAEVVASSSGDFRFFAAPGTWTVRALSRVGNGDVTVAPRGAGLHEVDVKVA